MTLLSSNRFDWLAFRAEERPDARAMSFEGSTWTYRELYSDASRIAAVLSDDFGIGPGDRVATLLGNIPEHALIIHALMLLGAVFVPLNTRLAAPELQRQIVMIQPKLLLSEIPIETDACPAVALRSLVRRIALRFMTVPPASSYEPAAETAQCIIFTSGSSGGAKPVSLTYGNHRANAAGSAANLGMRSDDDWLCLIALYHVGGLAIILRSVLYGAAFTLVERPDAESIVNAFEAGAITIVSMVPTVLRRLFDADAEFTHHRHSQLRAILLGGAPAHAALLDEALSRELPVFATYGLTEGSSQITTMTEPMNTASRGSAGKPIAGARISVRDDAGAELPPETTGQIWIQGGMVMSGYLGSDALNAARFSDDWFLTGDMGRLNRDGTLVVECRREDLIVTGGENVSPLEVEEALLSHPCVRDAAVVGLADEEWGQIIAAAIVRRDDSVTIEELLRHCRTQLAGYKIPKRYMFVASLPRTESGKLRKREVEKIITNEE
jgi:o-succinylbenzoate---CoA ligase